MKLRYVFPLMVAAAACGAAGLHFASEFNRQFDDYVERGLLMQNNEKVHKQVFEREYRNLAKSMGFLCPGLPKTDLQLGPQTLFTNFTLQVQKEWLEEREKLSGNSNVRRFGPSLRIMTGSGEVEFLDAGYLCFTNRPERFRYREKLEKTGFHVLDVIGWEWVDVKLVSPQSGRTFDGYAEIFESPNGARIATYEAAGTNMDGGGYRIYRVDSEGLKEESASVWLYDQRDAGRDKHIPIESIVGWIDDRTLLVTLQGREGQHVIVWADGKWQLGKSGP